MSKSMGTLLSTEFMLKTPLESSFPQLVSSESIKSQLRINTSELTQECKRALRSQCTMTPWSPSLLLGAKTERKPWTLSIKLLMSTSCKVLLIISALVNLLLTMRTSLRVTIPLPLFLTCTLMATKEKLWARNNKRFLRLPVTKWRMLPLVFTRPKISVSKLTTR